MLNLRCFDVDSVVLGSMQGHLGLSGVCLLLKRSDLSLKLTGTHAKLKANFLSPGNITLKLTKIGTVTYMHFFNFTNLCTNIV